MLVQCINSCKTKSKTNPRCCEGDLGGDLGREVRRNTPGCFMLQG